MCLLSCSDNFSYTLYFLFADAAFTEPWLYERLNIV